MIQRLLIIDDRVRGAATIFNTRAILAIEQDQNPEVGVIKINAVKGKKLKIKRRAGISEIGDDGLAGVLKDYPESEEEEGDPQLAAISDRRSHKLNESASLPSPRMSRPGIGNGSTRAARP